MMKKVIERFREIFSTSHVTSRFVLPLFAFCAVAIIYTGVSYINQESPSKILSLLLLDLILILLLVIISTRRILFHVFSDYKSSRIRARIILMFSIITAVPTVIISGFSVFIFNFGIQSWFDDKVSTSIYQSVRVADLYIAENKLQLREDAISVANDLSDLYFDLVHNPSLMNRVLSTQAELRSLNEAIIFQRHSNAVLAQTSFGFALSFWSIPQHSYEKAEAGEVTEVTSDRGKMRMLIKLREFDDTYLIVGRLVDDEIINYIDQTNGAAQKYKEMSTIQGDMLIKFAVLFIFLSLVLILSTISLGTIFANKISRPIRKLVKATELVQGGDLSVYVPIVEDKEDELVILTNAFNKMVKKIDIQQKDLALAQRTMAWSDVARRVAHEIKNPLTPISLSADRIQKKFINDVEDKESLKKYVDTILRHTKDIQNIISEFAEFAKMPSPDFERIDIIKIIRELTDSRQILHDKIKYNFSSSVESLDFVCDLTQINQVIVNLFKNAEEALEQVQYEKIITAEINLYEEDLEIIVRDNGKGFPSDLIDKVTEEYITTRSRGTGLGLAIVKKIVQDHGGEVLISNVKPSGGEVKLIFDKKHLILKSKK
jgi:two-component system nitrogen regulation sensor histidine kinase NtrY